MKKKLVVVLMAAVMAMTAVTGCGSKADDAKNDTQASKASESETSANADRGGSNACGRFNRCNLRAGENR